MRIFPKPCSAYDVDHFSIRSKFSFQITCSQSMIPHQSCKFSNKRLHNNQRLSIISQTPQKFSMRESAIGFVHSIPVF